MSAFSARARTRPESSDRRDSFTAAIAIGGPVTIGVPDIPYYVEQIRRLAPSATIRPLDDIVARLAAGALDVDAIALPAERGSAWTLLYPRYTVFVPGPSPIRLPLAYPIAGADDDFARVVDTWIQLKQKDGTIAALYDYWILGRSAGGAAPRWSVLRDVLHWVD